MDDLKARILEVIGKPQLMPLATLNEQGKPWVRFVVGVGTPDLSVRFVTGLQTRKVAQIKVNPEVHMAAGAASADSMSPYVQIEGRAEITTDREERERMWNDHLKAYFSGPDDPNYCVGIVTPSRIEYMGLDEMTPKVWEADG
jgi:general stress protein 26